MMPKEDLYIVNSVQIKKAKPYLGSVESTNQESSAILVIWSSV